ncbi:MAG TPA: cellulase family glycosylhydrolase [Acetobacteraceae bacterium]|nr:cellulase family glycosylhydrolase [Acetobacteraceae bacterium]
MARAWAFGWLLAVLISAGSVHAEVSADRLRTLSRGVNLTTAMDQRPLARVQADLAGIRRAGFRHIRIFVDPDRLAGDANRQYAPYRQRLDAVVRSAIGDGLGVILCMAPRETWTDTSPEAVERLWVQAWTDLSRHFAATAPDKLFFELANEPGFSDGTRWARIQETLRRAVRAHAPAHTLLLTASPTSTAAALTGLAPSMDQNVVYVFHLYQPMVFTHQGADWPGAAEYHDFAGLTYPPDAENIAEIARHADPARLERYARIGGEMMAREVGDVAAWAGAHHVPVSVTEFGVFRRAPPASRAAWLGEARHRLEAASFGWTLWEYEGGFGIKPELARGCGPIPAALGLCRETG